MKESIMKFKINKFKDMTIIYYKIFLCMITNFHCFYNFIIHY